MGDGQLWFGVVGTTRNHFRWMMQPALPVPNRRVGSAETMLFQNGGAAVTRSYGFHREFDFNIPIDYADLSDGIDQYADFAAGLYGDGLIHFADPFYYSSNLFAPHWASPMLCEREWPSIVSGGAVTFSNTAANAWSQPARKGTWSVTTAANATPLTDSSIPYVVLPIPPDMTLHLGVTGTATGTAAVRVELWANGASAAASTSSLTLLSETGPTRLNTTVSGATYAFAKVYVTRTSSTASTITPISMMAQLWPTGVTPATVGVHQPGRGHTGLRFADSAAAEDYQMVVGGRPYKGLFTRLVEVGAWQ